MRIPASLKTFATLMTKIHGLSTVVLVLVLLYLSTATAHGLSLQQKADLFQRDMEERFLLDGQALCKLKLPVPGRDFIAYNMPDNAYMTGMHTGTLAMKYAVTRDESDRQAALQSLKAMHLLCAVSGVPGVPARAAWPAEKPMEDDGIWRKSSCGRYLWRGDVSTDQVDGLMFGFALAFDLVADDEEKGKIARDVTAIVDRVLEHDMRIVDVDGKPTRWGRYGPDYVSRGERMNALLWLQALKVAAHVTGADKYTKLYTRWAVGENYMEYAQTARRMASPLFPGFVNHSDDVLIFLAYVPLLMYEEDETLRAALLASLQRTWEGDGRFPGVQPERNPFYAFVVARHLKTVSDIPGAADTLRWFPLDMKWNGDTIKKYEAALNFRFDKMPASPEPERGRPVPIDRRTKTWSAWVQDPYHSGGERTSDEPIEYNGHDYLLAYWTGRYYGFINEND